MLRSIIFALGFLLLFILNDENSVSCWWFPWKKKVQKVRETVLKIERTAHSLEHLVQSDDSNVKVQYAMNKIGVNFKTLVTYTLSNTSDR